MIYEEETALIRRGLFDVQNGVGLGRHEEIYHKALAMWLEKQGIPFVSKRPHPLMLNGETAHVLYPDFVVWNKITIELKAVPHRLQKTEHVQLFNYLKCRNDKLGLLVNMGLDRVHAERFVYESQNCKCVENWQYWNNQIAGPDRDIGIQIRDVLRNIADIHQTGYGTKIMEKLIPFGLKEKGLHVIYSPVGESVFQGCALGNNPFDCLLIEKRLLLVFTALFDDNQFNIHRGLSFMNSLNIPWGIAVNFGKRTMEIHGLAANKTSVGRHSHPWDYPNKTSVGRHSHPRDLIESTKESKGSIMNSKIEVFDPPMCCSSGVCGPEVDPKLVEFSAALKSLEQQGLTVTRHNMAQEPMVFAQNETVRNALQQDEKCLPLILLNGKIITKRTYPSGPMLAAAIGEAEE